jgi:hypothetical protein
MIEALPQWWELWYPGAAATGLPFARGRLGATDILWVHSAPDVLSVRVRDGDEQLLAAGHSLRRAGPQLPMTCLERRDDAVVREDRWPDDRDLGALVILPGGEVGKLVSWWNAGDGSEWRWRVEFENHR